MDFSKLVWIYFSVIEIKIVTHLYCSQVSLHRQKQILPVLLNSGMQWSLTQLTTLIFMGSPETFNFVTWTVLGVILRFCMEQIYFKAIALFSDQISWPSFMIYAFLLWSILE